MSATTYPLGAAPAAPRPVARTARTLSFGTPLSIGIITLYLSILVLIPLAAVVVRSTQDGLDGFIKAVTAPQALAALRLSVLGSLAVALINAVIGTIIAWVLVRDEFRGKGAVNALIDLPFALPTIVAGLTLIALYGARSPLGINVAYTQFAVIMALLFVTLPFVVRAVQPVLGELDRDMEQAATALGASGWTTFRLIVLPNLLRRPSWPVSVSGLPGPSVSSARSCSSRATSPSRPKWPRCAFSARSRMTTSPPPPPSPSFCWPSR